MNKRILSIFISGGMFLLAAFAFGQVATVDAYTPLPGIGGKFIADQKVRSCEKELKETKQELKDTKKELDRNADKFNELQSKQEEFKAEVAEAVQSDPQSPVSKQLSEAIDKVPELAQANYSNTPKLVMLKPSNLTQVTAGNTISVEWLGTNLGRSDIVVDLLKIASATQQKGAVNQTQYQTFNLASSTINDGKETLVVPKEISNGNYLVRISDTTNTVFAVGNALVVVSGGTGTATSSAPQSTAVPTPIVTASASSTATSTATSTTPSGVTQTNTQDIVLTPDKITSRVNYPVAVSVVVNAQGVGSYKLKWYTINGNYITDASPTPVSVIRGVLQNTYVTIPTSFSPGVNYVLRAVDEQNQDRFGASTLTVAL